MQIEPILKNNDIHEFKLFDTQLIKFEPEIRSLCEKNTCGNFKQNHMCPPAVDSIEKWKTIIQAFDTAVMVTKVYPTKNSFDFEGMQEGLAGFGKTLRNIKTSFEIQYPENKVFLLGAGPCLVCKTCSYIDNEPCRSPEKAHPSLEACGIDVISLAIELNLQYNNGENTITYFGMVLCQ